MRFHKIAVALLFLLGTLALSCSFQRHATKGSVGVRKSAQDSLAEILKHGAQVLYEDEQNTDPAPISEKIYERVQGLVLPRKAWVVAFPSEPKVTDDVIQNLENLDTVKVVYLVRLSITDQAMNHLSAMKNLNSLVLSDIPISDTGLESLANCSTLDRLHIHNSNVTDVGLSEFRKSRPDVELTLGALFDSDKPPVSWGRDLPE